MTSTARHARTPQPARRTRPAPRTPREPREFFRAWHRARAAVRYCSPDTARLVAWRVFLIGEASILAADFLHLVPRHFTRVVALAGFAGLMALLLAMDAHVRRQRRLWSQEGARRLILAPAEPVMPDDMWRRQTDAKVGALMGKMEQMCEKAGLPLPGEDDGEPWKPVVIQGGRNDPAA